MNALIEKHCVLIGLLAVLIGGATVNPYLKTVVEVAWMWVCAAAGLVLSLVLGV